MIQPVRIIVDHRETKSGVLNELRLMKNVLVDVQQLKVGDYLIPHQVLVERKCLLDLAQSLKDGRLFSQARTLAASEIPAAVILEGQGRDLIGSQMRREAMLGAIISLGLIFNLAVLRSSAPEETARILVYAAQQLHNHERDIPIRRGVRPKRRRRIQLHLLQGLPGVGPKKAQALLDRFGTVANIFEGSREDWQTLDGFGPKLVDKIWQALH